MAILRCPYCYCELEEVLANIAKIPLDHKFVCPDCHEHIILKFEMSAKIEKQQLDSRAGIRESKRQLLV